MIAAAERVRRTPCPGRGAGADVRRHFFFLCDQIYLHR